MDRRQDRRDTPIWWIIIQHIFSTVKQMFTRGGPPEARAGAARARRPGGARPGRAGNNVKIACATRQMLI